MKIEDECSFSIFILQSNFQWLTIRNIPFSVSVGIRIVSL